jgi:hypothetical protein
MDLGIAPWTQEIRTHIVNFLQGDFASSLPALYASWQARPMEGRRVRWRVTRPVLTSACPQ